jgi:hypothetical protein
MASKDEKGTIALEALMEQLDDGGFAEQATKGGSSSSEQNVRLK